MSHRGIRIIEGITTLQGKDRKETRSSRAKGFLKFIANSDSKKADTNVYWKDTDPYFSYKWNCLMESTHNEIERFCVSKVLCN